MAAPPTATARPPKVMSSRLMTMKFMQRAVASPIRSPASASPRDANKRPKLSSASSPPAPPPSAADQAIHAEIAREQTKREAAIERQAARAGETHWVLSVQRHGDGRRAAVAAGDGGGRRRSLHVVPTSYAGIDGGRYADPGATLEEEEEDQDEEGDAQRHAKGVVRGRMNFGNFNQPKHTFFPSSSSSEDEDEDEDDDGKAPGLDKDDGNDDGDDDDDEPSSATALIERARNEAAVLLHRQQKDERKRQRKAKAKALEEEEEAAVRVQKRRRDSPVKLHLLTSISGTAAASGPGHSDIQCYKCGGKGHKAARCVNNQPRAPGLSKRDYDRDRER
ncbi:MAG: hypothetical protein M1826_003878 [Phylliscum demangeonii]|nr:MAG: hypothetical protein M1826_003878 [Phylliscum demangeonii]